MSFTVTDYQDLVQLLRQRPEWQVELRHLLLDEDFLALPRLVSELAEAQREANVRLTRLEQTVQELAEAQRRTETRVEELAEAQRRTETRVEELAIQVAALVEISKQTLERLDRLEDSNLKLVNDSASYKGQLLELRYVSRAYSYFGRWLRRTRVVLPGTMDAETERRLTQALEEHEFEELLNLDILARGQLHKPTELAGQELWLAVEVSYSVDSGDVERAHRRAALLRKAGLRAIPVVAGAALTEGAAEMLQQPPIVLLLNGHASGWNESVSATEFNSK